MTDPYIRQDGAADNGRGGEGDGYPVTGNAEIDALLRRLPTELADECVHGREDRNPYALVHDLVGFLTPAEIHELRRLGRELRPEDEAYQAEIGETGNTAHGRMTKLSPLFCAMHEKDLRAAIVVGARDRYADLESPMRFSEKGFFVVRHLGSKPAVCRLNDRGELDVQTLEDFKKSYQEINYTYIDGRTGKPKTVKAAKHWLDLHTSGREYRWSDVAIRRYERADFLPGRDAPDDVFNMWRGWPDGCRPSDKMQPTDEDRCGLMLDHIRDNICGGDDHLNWWFLGFLRDMIVNPGKNRPVAVFMRGPQGSGKSMFCHLIGQWFGPHYLYAEDADRLFSRFNRHLDARVMVFLDEPKGSDLQREASKLKTLISSETINIERKGFDIEARRKVFRIFAATNDEHILKVARDDRRNLVLTVDAGEHNNDAEYFGALHREWHDGGREAMFRWLRDSEEQFADWDWNKRPVTKGLQEQRELSMTPVEKAVQRMLDDGTLPPMHRAEGGGSVFVATESFLEQYRLNAGERATANATSAGKLLSALATSQPRRTFNDPKNAGQSRQYRGYVLPPLAECRRLWAAQVGRPVGWANDDADWALVPEQDEIPF